MAFSIQMEIVVGGDVMVVGMVVAGMVVMGGMEAVGMVVVGMEAVGMVVMGGMDAATIVVGVSYAARPRPSVALSNIASGAAGGDHAEIPANAGEFRSAASLIMGGVGMVGIITRRSDGRSSKNALA